MLIAEIYHGTEDKAMKRWAKETLHWSCRNLERIAPRRASVKAQAMACKMKVEGDLRDYTWSQQPTRKAYEAAGIKLVN
jgi:hypothetical protein